MMVNQTQDTRTRILESLFRAGGRTLSGVKLSKDAGVSRVAVWKHIKGLKSSGIDIESHPNGYALVDPDNLMEPFCFEPDLRDKIFFFQELASTMDTAKTLAKEGAPHMSCCVAEHQTRGRGRLNRQWVTSRGGLWFTLILKPDLPPPMAYIYNFAAGLSLSRVMDRLYNLNARVKWPNDLLVGGRKLSGLLSEMETRADMVSFLVIGIGVNVNNEIAHEPFKAVSVKESLGRPVSRRRLLSEFLIEFRELTREISIPRIMALWRECTATIGTRVRVETLGRTCSGTAIDVDDTGALTIETQDKTHETIVYGDCFHF